MPTHKPRNEDPHKFESLGDFDKAIRHIANVPKEVVDERIAQQKAEHKEKPQS
jgi:hypothetical protein